MKALLLAASLFVAQSAAPQPLRILFVGNSLTYENNLPGMVSTLARSVGRPIATESIAQPNFGLEEHWQSGVAQRAIANGRWDIVVLQQGPSSQPDSRRILIDYTRRFDAVIKKAGARTALYMVWPSRQRRGDFEGSGQSYRAAAEAVGATLLPVGDAWRAALAADAKVPLYASDDFHPSGAGSYLAALVIFRHLLGQPAPATPVLGGALPYAGLLQAIANSTAAQYR
jgi:hypothetical protein